MIDSIRPESGGPIEGVKQLASAISTAGNTVEVASLDGPDDPCMKTFPMQAYSLGPPTLRYSYSRRFVPWLKENAGRYDVIVVNGVWQYHCFGAWLALRESNTPYVVFTHGMLDPWFKRTYPLKHLKKWIYWPWGGYRPLRDAAAVVFTCEEERTLARESFWLYEAREAVVGYGTAGPTGNAALQREAFLGRYPELRNRRLALFMGRIHEKKGCDLLIRAFARELALHPDWHLVIAGPDQVGWRSELESTARSMDVHRRITWTGMISGELKWGAIRSSEVFVLPSHQENFGIAVAEALACGVPVLISNKVNIWREVQEDGAGLVASDDLSGTCRVLARWAGMTGGERATMAANARPCFLRRFEIHAAAASFIQLLAAVVEGRPLPTGQVECSIANS